VSGCPWSSVSALCQAVCPCLKLLDLSRVEELKDSHLRELLAPPPDTRTGNIPVDYWRTVSCHSATIPMPHHTNTIVWLLFGAPPKDTGSSGVEKSGLLRRSYGMELADGADGS